jgi:hypothetical protein
MKHVKAILAQLKAYIVWLFSNKPEPYSKFWMAFTRAVHQRGCVAYFQEAVETKTNAAGITDKFAVEGTTTKLILLPGDDHRQINEGNLIAFEPLNRRTRMKLLKIRNNETRKGRKIQSRKT